MSQPFLGEVRAWACNFAPTGWMFCAGQTLPISQYSALFALIGTYYGGNGTSTFLLPNLQSRVPLKYGTAATNENFAIGEEGGVEQVLLTSQTMPTHNHLIFGTSASGNDSAPATGSAMATDSKGDGFYATTAGLVPINVGTVSLYQGGNGYHANIQPYLAINWCIAMRGIFPSRN